MSFPKVITIIPNWNLKEDLGECVASLLDANLPEHEIVVVDNASSNDAVAYLNQNFPTVKVFALSENLGYAGALYVGIRYALERRADYVFALNNDTVVPTDVIPGLAARMESDPGLWMVTPKVVYHSDPNILFSLGARQRWFFPMPIEYGHRWQDKPAFNKFMEYDYVTGCAVLIRVSSFAQVGTFDERYFMYYEDNEFCLRVRRAGGRIGYDGAFTLYHKASLSSKLQGALITYYRARNRVWFYRGLHRQLPARILTGMILWVMAVWYSLLHLVRGQWQWLRPYWSGFLQGWRQPL